MTSSPTSPLDVILAFLKAMETKDYDTALPLIADDCEYTNVPMATVHGPAGVRAVLEPFFAPTLRNEFIVLRKAVEGDTVFLDRLDRHQLGPDRWAEFPVTGVFEVRDGSIVLWRDNFDVATLVRQWPELAAALG
ncbi:limonene-1,2-epoxide hydrolase family protein [Phenylobacterium sp.]|uniref:limonene-1,2-epoxide hydrolase family protein n=1 Tax=Phenylobacterium sp. TaxID=1871053 RepID=UPI0025D846A1|nr:limonene-1,2-epoxide hydrolase family protein [Phenylobacterium sp.]